VERVSTTHPQAHVIVAFLYSGWIPAFMISSLVPEFYNIRKIALQSALRPRNHRKHVVFSQSGTRPARYLQGGCLLFNLPISREAQAIHAGYRGTAAASLSREIRRDQRTHYLRQQPLRYAGSRVATGPATPGHERIHRSGACVP